MNSNDQLFETPFGDYSLQRFPPATGKSPLRAWDAADQYLLQQLSEQPMADTDRLLLLNDQFGALGLALHPWQPQSSGDSFLSQQACRNNLQFNNLSADSLTQLDSLSAPEGPFDVVLIKIPKTLALLEDQLYRLRPHLTETTRILAAAMARDIHTSTLQLFERIIGPTKTSLARKKARLIFCHPQAAQLDGACATDSPYPSEYTLPETGWHLSNHANVFSQAKLDIGTRFFMEHIDKLPAAEQIIDLGCGNGLLGLLAAERQPEARIAFYDESHMALASAQENCRHILANPSRASFHLDNALASADSNSANLILNNPPFHQKNVVGDHIAWQMFKDAKRVLQADGELWVIGNRHLQYHAKLKKLFGNCQTAASNNKFVLLVSRKR
ncbi:MAG: 23S rRNA (guanine(1835)-N(2))-methyltransferase RlmG [Candidatus Pelagadaptatus aseana]|uniref:methyltransferase n=1 Tax=Candidatus Pelagadaptatus aseana TaxID=3120508 RepID=UPI0039B34B31